MLLTQLSFFKSSLRDLFFFYSLALLILIKTLWWCHAKKLKWTRFLSTIITFSWISSHSRLKWGECVLQQDVPGWRHGRWLSMCGFCCCTGRQPGYRRTPPPSCPDRSLCTLLKGEKNTDFTSFILPPTPFLTCLWKNDVLRCWFWCWWNGHLHLFSFFLFLLFCLS